MFNNTPQCVLIILHATLLSNKAINIKCILCVYFVADYGTLMEKYRSFGCTSPVDYRSAVRSTLL